MSDFDDLISLLDHLPAALVKVRADLGLKSVRAIELARSKGCRVNAAALSHWENGNKTPTMRPLLCYLAALGKNLCDLHRAMLWAAGGKPEPEPLDEFLDPPEGKEDSPEVKAFTERTDFEDLLHRVEELEHLQHRVEELEWALLERGKGEDAQ